MKDLKSVETKEVWVVWVNSDGTEGRGYNYPLAICDAEATAKRLGHGKDVMGSNATLSKVKALRIGGKWYGPVDVIAPTIEDVATQRHIDRAHAAVEKAKAAGLSDEDIAELRRP